MAFKAYKCKYGTEYCRNQDDEEECAQCVTGDLGLSNYMPMPMPCRKGSPKRAAPTTENGPQPELRPILEKMWLDENAPGLKNHEKWFAKGFNAAIKKALASII